MFRSFAQRNAYLFLGLLALSSPACAQFLVVSDSPIVDPIYLLAFIPLTLLFEWPFIKKITGRSWSGSLLPLFVMNIIGLPIGAGLVIGPWLVILVLGVIGIIPGYIYLFFTYCILPIALVPAIAGGELVTAKIFFWSSIKGDLKDYIMLCVAQIIKLSLVLLAVLLETGSIG